MIEINCAVPDFTLMGSDNQEHKLSQYRGKKVILYFYPIYLMLLKKKINKKKRYLVLKEVLL